MNDDIERLVLTRFCYADQGTFGEMMVDGYRIFTVEQPWNNNKVGASCIPGGRVYRCKPGYYHKGEYDCIEITGVPGGRSRILIHKANWPHQLGGCIAPVLEFGCLNDMLGGPSSSSAFNIVMGAFGGKEFELEIKDRSFDWGDWA